MRMMHRCGPASMLLGVLAMGLAGTALQPATEAPAWFDTPTLAQNPGSQQNNGLRGATGDSFALDHQVYERVHDVGTGLGLHLQRKSVCRVPSKPGKWRREPIYRVACGSHRTQTAILSIPPC